MSDEIQISEQLSDLVLEAFEHAFESISEGDPLVPFAFVERGGKRDLRRYMAEDLAEAVEAGRKAIGSESPKPERAAFAFDGYVRSEDERLDAIFIEAYEAGSPTGFRFVMPYQPRTESSELELLDEEPSVFDECDPLF